MIRIGAHKTTQQVPEQSHEILIMHADLFSCWNIYSTPMAPPTDVGPKTLRSDPQPMLTFCHEAFPNVKDLDRILCRRYEYGEA